MDWKMQLGISIVVPIISSLLTYFAAIIKSKNEMKSVQINANTEIEKIKEESKKEIKNIEIEYKKQIEKLKIETDEQIRLKMAERDMESKSYEEKLKNDATGKFFEQFINDPQKGIENLGKLKNLADILKP